MDHLMRTQLFLFVRDCSLLIDLVAQQFLMQCLVYDFFFLSLISGTSQMDFITFLEKKIQCIARFMYFFFLQELLLSCVGQGPSVSVTAAKLNFGCIPVLTDVTRTLELSNDSPIPARFLAQMVGSIVTEGTNHFSTVSLGPSFLT